MQGNESRRLVPEAQLDFKGIATGGSAWFLSRWIKSEWGGRISKLEAGDITHG